MLHWLHNNRKITLHSYFKLLFAIGFRMLIEVFISILHDLKSLSARGRWWWLPARRLLRHHLCKQILLLGYHNFHISTDNTFLMTKIASLSASAHLVATSQLLTRDFKGLYNWSFTTFYVSTLLTIGEPVLLPFYDVIEKQGLIRLKF